MDVKDFLRDAGVKPIVFVLSDPARSDRAELQSNLDFLDIEALRSLGREGWDIGCHSATHPDFGALTSAPVRLTTAVSASSLRWRFSFVRPYN